MSNQTYTAGTTPQETIKAAAEQQTPDGYKIACWPNSEEFDALQRMTAQGIDSRLEAIHFEQETDSRGAPQFTFDPQSVSVLCRRLAESENDADLSLRIDILGTLGIEEV
tara:strand:+ start:179939 stop:180268 length:330 start_codon:yes stop_codon:yes gene_type:complete